MCIIYVYSAGFVEGLERMRTRIHLILEEAEKERYRRQAEAEGKSLAAWLREAAREKLASGEERTGLDTVEELDAFFAECDRRETRPEADWEDHRRVIERSQRAGASDT